MQRAWLQYIVGSFLVGLLIQSFPASVLAQNQGSEAAPTVLQPIVTTATRSERSLADLPVSVTVLEREQIQTAPAHATDDILRTVPSLNLPLSSTIVQHPPANLVGIRGLGAPRVLFLLDGIPINDPFFGYVQFNKIVQETIERIEVVRGGSASLWGNYAMGGVVNIVTRPTEARAANAEVLYGSYNTVRTNVYGSYRLSEHVGLSLNVNYYNTDGYVVAPRELGGPIDTRAASQAGNVQVKTDYHDTGIDWFLRGNFFTQDQNTGTVLSDNSTNRVDIATGAKWKVDTASDVRASLFFQQQEFKTDNTDPVTPGQRDAEFFSNRHHTPVTDLGGSLQYTRRLGAVFREALVGVDLRRITGEDRAINFSSPTAAPTIENAGGTQFFAGLFSQVSITPVRGLELLPSVRVEYYRNSNGHDEQSPGTTQNFKDESFGQFNPKLAVRYQVLEPVALRAAFYRAFRAPNLDELYRSFTAIGFGIRPNPFLKPEVLYGGEGGLDITYGPLTGQVPYFWNEISDRIGSIPVSFMPIFVVQNVNLQRTRSRGVEVLGAYRPLRWLTVSGGYTSTDARILEDPSNPDVKGARVPNVSQHFATFTLQYRFPLRGTYTFDLEITPVPGGPVFPPTSRRQPVRIPEHPVMMRHTLLLVVGLFVLGVITGVLVSRYAAARAKRRSRALIGLLVVCCGALAPIRMVAAHAGHPEHAAYGAPERQVIWGDDGWELEIHSIPMPVTVGHLLQLALWLRKDDGVFPGMTEVSIAAVNLEEDQTVVETHILARQGSTSQSHQLFDGVPHAIAVTVHPVGGDASSWAPPTVMLSVDVIAGDPPLAVPIRMIAIWLGVLVGRMVVGFFVSRMSYRGVVHR